MKWKAMIVVLGLLLVGLILVGCGATPEPCPDCPACPECPAVAECPECPTTECPACPECPEAVECPECPTAECPEVECPGLPAGLTEIPFADMWAASGHADAEAEAFRHWDEDDPKEVPTGCAQCHSSPGYQDYIGADGSAMWSVEQAAPVDTVINCTTCHNAAASALAMEAIPFPSGITLTVGTESARCVVCHQGRSSTPSVNAAIENAGVVDEDTVSADLRFTNIHYFAAAASLYGTWVQGGYQYDGMAYDAKFDHVEGYDSCADCHSPHSLELKLEECSMCHDGVATTEDLKDIRMEGSTRDYNGNGDVEEGIYYEVAGLQEMLLQAIQAYGSEVAQSPIAYSAASYPYFFVDANANGQVDEGEADGYASWTPRLLKAAYNYQTSIKDPGAFAHGGKYMIELLYDSTVSLNEKISTPVDLSMAQREDAGHFDSASEAFRHWDGEGMVQAGCVKCHQAEGLPQYLENGANVEMPVSGSLHCTTCHDEANWPARYETAQVTFPSGKTVGFENMDSNLCLNCHQGRESGVSVEAAIARVGVEDDTVSDSLSFRNPHYFAAGATLFGADAQGAYQYEGKEYLGRFAHVPGFDSCVSCHSAHDLNVQVDACSACHTGVESEEDLMAIRMGATDYDGDGDTAEGMAEEVAGVAEQLYAALQAYASDTAGTGIEFNANAYPYWFTDTGERYATWTPRLLRGAYNYTWAIKDPGAYAHNGKYIIQVMYDSIEDLGGDVGGLTRP